MAESTFADPTIQDENTRKVLSILPPIEQQTSPKSATATITRPSDNHAQPHTLPPVQEQIRETSQPYRPQPVFDDRPSGSSIGGTNLKNSSQIRQQNLGIDMAMANGSGALIGDLNYEGGYYFSGLLDGLKGKEDYTLGQALTGGLLEKSFYDKGHDNGEQVRDAINHAKDAVKDLIDNPPHFEIPRPQIPKIELPKIPEFKFPELPEFEIPGFRLPEPQDKDRPIPEPKINEPTYKPIPLDPERQLRELELSECGKIIFVAVYCTKILGEYWVPNADNTGGYFELIRVGSSLSQIYADYKKAYPDGIDYEHFPYINGGYGGRDINEVSTGVSYFSGYVGGGYVNTNGRQTNPPFGVLNYPYHVMTTYNIEVRGSTNKYAINAILDHLGSTGYSPTIFKILASETGNSNCPLDKPPTPEPEPPPPPKKKMCCPEIDYRRIKAMIDDAISKLDLVAAIPQSWQIRNEGARPQLVIQCAEENGIDSKGNKKYKSAMYPISVPHWSGSASDKISLPSYIKGNYEGIYTLNDNSKVTINAKNETECKRILNAIIPRIPKQYTKDAYFKGGVIVRDEPIKESRVKPRYGRYFKNGQKNNKPDWRVNFT